MKTPVSADNPFRSRTDLLAGFLFEGDRRLAWQGASLPSAEARALKGPLRDFRGRARETSVAYSEGGARSRRILLVGLGKRSDFDPQKFREAVGTVARKAMDLGARTASLLCPPWRDLPALGKSFAEGMELAAYRFDPFKSNRKKKAGGDLRSAALFLPSRKGIRQATESARIGRIIARSGNIARDLGNTPSNHATPTHLARKAQEIARKRRLTCRILREPEMRRLRMGALLGVARGSHEGPRFIILEYKGKGRGDPIVLVGKGITFDSGGISIKPAQKMEEMKFDMCGGAAVLGVMDAIAQIKIPRRVVGLVPCTENLPGGSAQKPGDVVRALSGKTIEVINTDAEGRLILADALGYAQRYRPAAVIDLATLTGACIIALGHHAAGLMGTDSRLIRNLKRAGERSGERVWELPLWDPYMRQIESTVADVKNTGGRPAGTITAGLFLKEFAGDAPWAHLDIAGVAWTDDKGPIQEKGATGFGVRLIVEYLLDSGAR